MVGTRPEIIRMSEIMKKFDTFFEHRLIHTGQNPDPLLKDIFFKDLGLRDPDLYFGGDHTSLAGFLSNLFIGMEKELNVKMMTIDCLSQQLVKGPPKMVNNLLEFD